jgi:outer membrane protein assembly factor BamD
VQVLRIILLFVGTIVIFSGCSKTPEVYNKPALYWYQHMVASIAEDNLDKADDYYGSLQGEHISSPLLPEATLILAIAHMKNQEYLLANHFLNEYIKRYANPNQKEYCEYLKVKASYLGLPMQRKDQAALNEAIKAAKHFKVLYPSSEYAPIVNSMLTRMLVSRSLLDRSISLLYKRIDKPLGERYYKELDPQKWIAWKEVQGADIPWYEEWFVGNGKGSWYGFMIPDTINVVSKRSYAREIQTLKDLNATKKETGKQDAAQ